MTNFKILITDGLDSAGIDHLRSQAVVDDHSGISADELLKIIADYDALIVRGRTKVTRAVLDAGAKLKVIGRAGVGVDNIDLSAASAKGMIVVNAPIATSIAVAELAFGLLLATARGIARADATMKQGQWLKKEFEGVELFGKTLGVIGYGRIGAEVGRRASVFGMKVLGYDPLIASDEIDRRGAYPVALDDLFAKSDFISMHIPLTDGTRNLINAESIAKMKTGVRIVCAARGGVINESDLLEGISAGKIAAVGLDVFSVEPPGLSEIVSHPQVICTPHIGAQTIEAQERASIDIASEVLIALNGGTLRWRVA
jgi:D-3-phosphoglycerate dehydrogenase